MKKINILLSAYACEPHRGTEPWRPTQFYPIPPAKQPISAETMNGNCVLIPSAVARQVGNLDPAFTHGIGDYDCGLRAGQVGLSVILAPGYYGYCQRNTTYKTQSWQNQLKWMVSPHGLPPREWAIFTKRHTGWLWPIFWLSPYIKGLFKAEKSNGKNTGLA